MQRPILGFSQWCVLRLSFRRSFSWIIANALAWSLGLMVGFMNADLIYADDAGINRF
ncbi:MAG: hypothetical protein MUC48_09505 [Leptolyngbya sp. Prado105]|nr:hypothetical protein [Leptolyngbya sp. Prado105]